MLEAWYIDWQLAGCRRLLDRSSGAISVVKALRKLHRVAPDVTVDMLVDTWSEQDSVRSRGAIEDDVRRYLGKVTRMEPQLVKCLTKRAVKRDEEALLRANADVVRLADVRVAHMDARAPALNVTSRDVDRLVNDVLEIVSRWVGLLRGAYLVNEIDAPMETAALTRALKLFDWHEYVESLGEALYSYGPAQPPGLREQLEAGVHLRYEWPDLHS